MKKSFISLVALIVMAAGIHLVSFAEGIVNAPPKNLNIKVVDDLSKFAGVNDSTFKEWSENPVDVQKVQENGNTFISIEKTSDNFSIVQFTNNCISIKDYVSANGGKRPYGIAMYVKTEDSDVEIWTMRVHDAEDSWTKEMFLYDMNGQLVTSNADKETHSTNGVVIPYEFEGYLITTFPDTMSYTECTYLAFWLLTEPNGILYIDNIGLVSSKPTETSVPSTATKTPAVTSTAPVTTAATETVTPTDTETPDTTTTVAVTATTVPPTTVQATTTASAGASDTTPKSGGWILWAIIGAVVIAGGAVAFILINKKKRAQ